MNYATSDTMSERYMSKRSADRLRFWRQLVAVARHDQIAFAICNWESCTKHRKNNNTTINSR